MSYSLIKLSKEQKSRLKSINIDFVEKNDGYCEFNGNFEEELRSSSFGEGYDNTSIDSIEYAVSNYITKRLLVTLILMFPDLSKEKVLKLVHISEKICG